MTTDPALSEITILYRSLVYADNRLRQLKRDIAVRYAALSPEQQAVADAAIERIDAQDRADTLPAKEARYPSSHCAGCGAWYLAGHADGCKVAAAEHAEAGR